MNRIPSDVFKSYPDIGLPLIFLSKDLNKLTVGVRCDTYPATKELTLYIKNDNYTRLTIFFLYSNTNYMKSLTHLHDPLLWESGYMNTIMMGELEVNNETGEIKIKLPTFEFGMSKETITEEMENADECFVDVKNAYKIFSLRKDCLIYENYAKYMTIAYFNHIIDKLNSPEKIHLLHFYLIINAVSLELFDGAVVSQIVTDNKTINEQEYYNNTVTYANDLIELITDKINTIFCH
jgi:hypothetical protein